MLHGKTGFDWLVLEGVERIHPPGERLTKNVLLEALDQKPSKMATAMENLLELFFPYYFSSAISAQNLDKHTQKYYLIHSRSVTFPFSSLA